MSKIIIRKTSAIKVFEFAGEELNVKGEVHYDPNTKVIDTLSGSFYEKADPETGINGDFVGSFNGNYVDGSLRYTINDMTIENAQKVTGLIAEVDAYAQQIINTVEDSGGQDESTQE